MIPVSLQQIADDVTGRLLGAGHEDATASSVTIDSRQATAGTLFVAIPGERVNGHDYVHLALEQGASAALVEDPERALATGADPARLIAVPSTQDALGDLARHNLVRVREAGNPLVVGVTGSVGKTTTKDLLAVLLEPRGPIIAPPGSFNNEIGLPLTVLRADENTATLVLEMGADRVGNLEHLTGIAPLDIGVVLAVARAHLGEFGGIEKVAQAKAELVTGIKPGGTAVLNADDHRVAAMAELASDVRRFSRLTEADVYATDIQVGADGRASFTLHSGPESALVHLGLVGEHHVSNALAAATVAIIAGTDLAEVARLLGGLGAASPHRMDVWTSGALTIIDDSYNANPDSMRAGLRALAQIGGSGTKTAVLGVMLELGEESDAEHAAIGTELADLGIDTLISVGAPPLAESARRAGVEVAEVSGIEEAWSVIMPLLESPGTILFKGSNGSKIWQLADRVKEETC